MRIKELLRIANIVPKKEFDQYFLQDDKILEEEVALAKLTAKDTVLEVGAGIGNLTLLLSRKTKVVAIEKDYGFTHILKNIPNTNVIMGDALETLESLRSRPGAQFNKIVSNIPYSISQLLLLEFFRHKWDICVMIVQKEFAEKLTSKERLGMLMSDIADVKIVKTVPADYFYPVAVPSSLVIIKQRKQLDDNFWKFLGKLKPNKNVGSLVKKAPAALAKKKCHQLTLTELKKLYKL